MKFVSTIFANLPEIGCGSGNAGMAPAGIAPAGIAPAGIAPAGIAPPGKATTPGCAPGQETQSHNRFTVNLDR